MKIIRNELMEYLTGINNRELEDEIEKMVFDH